MNRKQQQIEQLKEFAQLLLENGFTVLVDRNHEYEWLHFEKGGRFGTAQPDGFSAFNFSSDHKPCRSHGTGLGTAQHAELTIENAIDAINAQGWWHDPAIKHYQSVEEFIRSHRSFNDYYELVRG